MSSKTGTTIQVCFGLFVLGMMGVLMFELRALDEKLARLESEQTQRAVAASRAPRAAAGGEKTPDPRGATTGVPPTGEPTVDLAQVQDEMGRMQGVIQQLERRLGEVTERAGKLEQQAAQAPAVAVAGATDANTAAATDPETLKANADMQAAGTKAWLETELEKLVDAVGLSDAQKESARDALRGLMEKYFPKGATDEKAWERWGEFMKEWRSTLKGTMTTEQQNQYAAYEKKQTQEQVNMSAHWTVSTLEAACGLQSGQRDRVAAKVKEYYAANYQNWWEGESGNTSTWNNDQLRDVIRSELSADQIPAFDKWFKQYMGGGAGTSTTIEIEEQKSE